MRFASYEHVGDRTPATSIIQEYPTPSCNEIEASLGIATHFFHLLTGGQTGPPNAVTSQARTKDTSHLAANVTRLSRTLAPLDVRR